MQKNQRGTVWLAMVLAVQAPAEVEVAPAVTPSPHGHQGGALTESAAGRLSAARHQFLVRAPQIFCRNLFRATNEGMEYAKLDNSERTSLIAALLAPNARDPRLVLSSALENTPRHLAIEVRESDKLRQDAEKLRDATTQLASLCFTYSRRVGIPDAQHLDCYRDSKAFDAQTQASSLANEQRSLRWQIERARAALGTGARSVQNRIGEVGLTSLFIDRDSANPFHQVSELGGTKGNLRKQDAAAFLEQVALATAELSVPSKDGRPAWVIERIQGTPQAVKVGGVDVKLTPRLKLGPNSAYVILQSEDGRAYIQSGTHIEALCGMSTPTGEAGPAIGGLSAQDCLEIRRQASLDYPVSETQNAAKVEGAVRRRQNQALLRHVADSGHSTVLKIDPTQNSALWADAQRTLKANEELLSALGTSKVFNEEQFAKATDAEVRQFSADGLQILNRSIEDARRYTTDSAKGLYSLWGLWQRSDNNFGFRLRWNNASGALEFYPLHQARVENGRGVAQPMLSDPAFSLRPSDPTKIEELKKLYLSGEKTIFNDEDIFELLEESFACP